MHDVAVAKWEAEQQAAAREIADIISNNQRIPESVVAKYNSMRNRILVCRETAEDQRCELLARSK
jgi:hypothetical protein